MNLKSVISECQQKFMQVLTGNVEATYICGFDGTISIPLYDHPVSAGFPSPAADHVEARLTTDTYLVKNPVSTFFVKVKGDSMIDAGITHGDILIVDRSIAPVIGNIVLAELDGEFTVKYLGHDELIPANTKYNPIRFVEGQAVSLVGVVSGLMRKYL
jgi:DNA polymerase V